MSERPFKMLDIEVKRDIYNNRFYVLYQPKIHLSTGQVVGLEALIRKRDEDGKEIFPDQFIPIYEKNKTIHIIDFYMIKMGAAQLKRWKEKGEKMIPIAINICADTLLRNDFIQYIEETLQKEGLMQYMELEITERSIPLERIKVISNLVDQLRKKGMRVAIDDFGTGKSNLILFAQLNINTLKLDESIVRSIHIDKRVEIIVKGIIDICKEADICIVIEGIENKEQLEKLKDLGGEIVQGYYFSKPVDISMIREVYRKD